jgi:hypothetical protein
MSGLDVERLAQAIGSVKVYDLVPADGEPHRIALDTPTVAAIAAEYARLAESRASNGLAAAARDYLLHDGSGLDRTDEWAGDYDARKMLDARERLRAALAAKDPE